MATSIYFNGRLTHIPGSYSEVDASGLAKVGLGATGIVACIGEAEGGKPQSIISVTNPGKVSKTFRDGDLKEAGLILFDPSKDPDIPGGAQEVKFVKVNPALQSAITLDNSDGDAITLTSEDYGLFTTQISVDVAAGTNQGTAVTLKLGSTEEVLDDIGGDAIFTLAFSGEQTVVNVAVDPAVGVTTTFTHNEVGQDGDKDANVGSGNAVKVVSTDAADTTQTVTVYGVDSGTGLPASEDLSLNGTTDVTGTTVWSAVHGFVLDAVAAGVVTLSDATTSTQLFDLAAAGTEVGVEVYSTALTVNSSTLSITADAATTQKLILIGTAGGAATLEEVTLSGTTPVVTTTDDWESISAVAVGYVEAARTVTIAGGMFTLAVATYATIEDVADYFDTQTGFTFTEKITDAATFAVSDMDKTAASDVQAATISYYADLFRVVERINAASAMVTAAAASGATGVPDNTSTPQFLSGGVEGTTAFSNWQAALDLLRDVRVNTIVVLTEDEAVHAAVLAHCVYMAGAGRSERDCILGADSSETLTELKARAVALNTRHARLCGQDVIRYNSDGTKETFAPFFTACVAAGMQAGSEVGTSLTFKYMNVIDVEQDATVVLQDDADAMIQAGLLMIEEVPNIGFRWLRNVTTYLIDNNIAYIEGSVNEAVNYATYEFRTKLETAVGKKGFAGTVNAALGVATGILGELVAAGALTSWKNLTITIASDVMTVDVEIAPVVPVNFVKNTIHLVSSSFSAAA